MVGKISTKFSEEHPTSVFRVGDKCKQKILKNHHYPAIISHCVIFQKNCNTEILYCLHLKHKYVRFFIIKIY